MEETPRDIACKRKAFPLRILEPLLMEGNTGTRMIPQELRQTISAEWKRQPGDKRETAKKISTYPQEQVDQKARWIPLDHLGTPSEKTKTQNNQKEPQEQRIPLKIFPQMDTYEKLVK